MIESTMTVYAVARGYGRTETVYEDLDACEAAARDAMGDDYDPRTSVRELTLVRGHELAKAAAWDGLREDLRGMWSDMRDFDCDPFREEDDGE